MAAIHDTDLDHRRALLDAWVEKRRRIAVLESEASALLADRMALSQADASEHPFHRDAIHRSMIAEYAAAGRLSTGAMEYAFTDAAFLHRSHPEVRAAFRSGSITAAHVRAIIREGGVVREAVMNGRADAEAAGDYDAGAVIVAQSESPARTAVHVRALARCWRERQCGSAMREPGRSAPSRCAPSATDSHCSRWSCPSTLPSRSWTD